MRKVNISKTPSQNKKNMKIRNIGNKKENLKKKI